MYGKREFENAFSRKTSNASALTLALAIVLTLMVALTQAAPAQTYRVIYAFTGGIDGSGPPAGVTMDAAGNLYGTAFGAGAQRYGTVFKLSHQNSSWVFAPLYSFQNVPDGANPGARVIFSPNGALYGTTYAGGAGCNGVGCGTVFKLTPPATFCRNVLCSWDETVLHRFEGGNDGFSPFAEVVFDRAGNLYGTTYGGGTYDSGTVYQMTSSGAEGVIYSFTGGSDGALPQADVILDSVGNLYGTTSTNGAYGTVYELTPSGSRWIEHTLHGFENYGMGASPIGGVIFDASGDLFGTTVYSGSNGGGTVFELTPLGGIWAFTVTYALHGNGNEGPSANLILDSDGNLYGTTYVDGAYGFGGVFKLTRSGSEWTYTSLHDFTGGSDGGGPLGQVIFGANGNLYGTTALGGNLADCDGVGCGGVFEITP